MQAALGPGGPAVIELCPDTIYEGRFDIGRGVTVVGAGVTSSVLDGGGTVTTVVIGEDVPDVELRDLGVRNGIAGEGGGIHVTAGAELTLTRCAVTDNEAVLGGGIEIGAGATVTLDASVVADNEATRSGGGIEVQQDATLTLRGNSLIACNNATTVGGGIDNLADPDAVAFEDQSCLWSNQPGDCIGTATCPRCSSGPVCPLTPWPTAAR